MALDALAELRRLRPDDWQRGVHRQRRGARPDAAARRRSSGSSNVVEFAGWRGDDDIRRILSTRGRLPGAGPAKPAERRLDDGQDPGVHGDRAGDRQLRPARDADFGRRDAPPTRVGRPREPRALRARAARRSRAPPGDGRRGAPPGEPAVVAALIDPAAGGLQPCGRVGGRLAAGEQRGARPQAV